MSSVNVSAQTIDVLKSFEEVNKSIMFRKGNLINSRSLGSNIVAEYQCEEEFPEDFPVYELSRFLSGLALFESPSLWFNSEEYVTIRNSRGNRSGRYFYSDPSIVEDASPERRVKFPEETVVMQFKISNSDLDSLLRARTIYDINDLRIEGSDSGISITLFDSDNETNNTFRLDLPGSSSTDQIALMKINNILAAKSVKGDYDVSITDNLITRWKHTTLDLVYYIATEEDED